MGAGGGADETVQHRALRVLQRFLGGNVTGDGGETDETRGGRSETGETGHQSGAIEGVTDTGRESRSFFPVGRCFFVRRLLFAQGLVDRLLDLIRKPFALLVERLRRLVQRAVDQLPETVVRGHGRNDQKTG